MTTKKMTYKTVAGCILTAAITALLLSACTADRADARQGDVPVMLMATVLENSGAAATRAALDAQLTKLPDGTEIEVMLTGSDVTKTTATYVSDGAGGLTSSAPPYFTIDGTTTTASAFYGKSGGAAGNRVTAADEAFTVAANQSQTVAGTANYLAADLMYASATVTKGTCGMLPFAHMLSRIVVNVTAGQGIGQIQGVYIIGGQPTIALSGGNCTLGAVSGTAFSAASPLTMYAGGTEATAACAAILPPQTIDGSFLKVTTDRGDITYTLDAKAFASTKSYTFNITATLAAVGTTAAITDWTTQGAATVMPTVSSAHAPIDLGLSVMWANINVGATSETDCGTYFMWGDVAAHPSVTTDDFSFGWATYKWTGDGGATFTKYTGSDYTVLQSADDAATAHWGPAWRIPTKEEMAELLTLPRSWTDDYNGTGIAGYTFTGNGNTIFIPAAGYRGNTIVSNRGTDGYCWTSTHDSENLKFANHLHFNSNAANVYGSYRYAGCTIRPVYRLHPVSMATSADVGKLICTDGHIHAYNADADCCTASRVAMIAYVGSNNGMDGMSSYSAYLNHGLAIALTNANSQGEPATQATGITYTDAINVAKAYKVVSPSPSSGWFLPSLWQAMRIFEDCGGQAFQNEEPSLDDTWSCGDINNLLVDCGGTSFTSVPSQRYWTATLQEGQYPWIFLFDTSNWSYGSSSGTVPQVRPVIAF